MRPKDGGAALRRRRIRKQFTQRELGLLVGCSHAMIGLLERDGSTVGDDLATKIAKRLECDVEDLFTEHRLVRTATLPTASRASKHPA